MDTEARIEAAKAALDANRAVLLRAREAGPPCLDCIHYVAPKWGEARPSDYPDNGAYCGHLAYVRPEFDAATGALKHSVEVPVATARGEGGLCGFEASLFEPKAKPVSYYIGKGRTVAYWSSIYLVTSGVIWATAYNVIEMLIH